MSPLHRDHIPRQLMALYREYIRTGACSEAYTEAGPHIPIHNEHQA